MVIWKQPHKNLLIVKSPVPQIAKLSDPLSSKLTNNQIHKSTFLQITKLTHFLTNTNLNTAEKFAREKYFMKKDNEDVFVIIHEEKKD